MLRLFLIPVINLFEVHDSAIKDWLNGLDDASVGQYLDNPFKLERYFTESGRRALAAAEKVHRELLTLLDAINPQAVLLDISIDLYELENKYNKRLISPQEFWEKFHETVSGDMNEPHRSLYAIHLKDIIDKNIRLIESKDRLPLSIVFYGLDLKSREEIIPVYEEAFLKDGDFTLHAARSLNEIINFREKPHHLWYSPMKIRQMAISYEETEKFYNEFLNRLRRLLEFKVRDYFLKNLSEKAKEFVSSYEKFLEYKIKEDSILFSNIIEGLKVLGSQSGHSPVVVLCEPIHYAAMLDFFEQSKSQIISGISVEHTGLNGLLNEMKPFLQKNRIMQNNYDIALKILELKKPKKFEIQSASIAFS